MEEPIVSIYDLLMKRYRQQRKDDLQQQKDRRQSRDELSKNVAEPKKPRSRPSRPKLTTADVKTNFQVTTNVVSAIHLTAKEQPAIVIPPPTDKVVLNKLVERMSAGGQQKRAKKPTETEPAEQLPAIRVSSAKKRSAAARAKAKAGNTAKSSCRSESNGSPQQQQQLILSPRNANRMEESPGKAAKAKVSTEAKVKAPDALRSKGRLRTRKSKVSFKSDGAESVDNAVRYRL